MRDPLSAFRLLVVLVLLLLPRLASAQVSPGPLSAAHEKLEGIRHCRDCHGGGNDSMDGKCLECHSALARTIELDHGLHSREGRSNCASCHPEHGGRDFALVDWGKDGREAFDHSRTGWVLEGKHAQTKCEDCHKSERQQKAIVLRRPEGAGDETLLGLDTGCRSCHTDVHKGQLGTDCASCHTSRSWRQVENFDHARTGYPLRGRHAKLECVACHANGKFGRTPGDPSRMHLSPIAHDECSACHKDPHGGRFGPACSRCHVEDDFKHVPSDRFDHDKTRYPLRGAHIDVKCARCHEPAQGGFGPKPAFARCTNCHEDAHAGTATLAGKVVDCAACHEVAGFRPSTFNVAAHAETKFPLEGKHATVGCEKCHRRSDAPEDLARLGRARVELRPVAERCTSCHQDAHGGQLAQRADRGACESCHTPADWKKSTFTVARHDETQFALHGAHAAAPCSACHGPDRPGLRPLDPDVDRGKARVALRIEEQICEDCHLDVHRGRYSKGGKAASLGPCDACHGADRFSPSKVDIDAHDAYGMRLEGAHRVTPCIFCHHELENGSRLPAGSHALVDDPPLPDVVLWELPTACQACHKSGVPK